MNICANFERGTYISERKSIFVGVKKKIFFFINFHITSKLYKNPLEMVMMKIREKRENNGTIKNTFI